MVIACTRRSGSGPGSDGSGRLLAMKIPTCRNDAARKEYEREYEFHREISALMPDSTLKLCGHGADSPWIVMEMADGTLHYLLHDRSEDPEQADFRRTMLSNSSILDLVGIVSELHRNRFIHGDLKPENIMYVGDRWKLGDFGSARKAGTPGSLTGSRGTPGYELSADATDPAVLSMRKDVEDLGKILYQVEMARNPPEGGVPEVPDVGLVKDSVVRSIIRLTMPGNDFRYPDATWLYDDVRFAYGPRGMHTLSMLLFEQIESEVADDIRSSDYRSYMYCIGFSRYIEGLDHLRSGEDAEAERCFRAAADRGIPNAMHRLAMMYEERRAAPCAAEVEGGPAIGDAKNIFEERIDRLYESAIEKDYEPSMVSKGRRDLLRDDGEEGCFLANPLIFGNLIVASFRGDARARLLVSAIYYLEKVQYPFAYKTIRWCLEASEKDADAARIAGKMFLEGWHVRRDEATCRELFRKAEAMGDRESASILRRLDALEPDFGKGFVRIEGIRTLDEEFRALVASPGRDLGQRILAAEGRSRTRR